MPCLSETRWFLQSSSFCKARRALIGLLSGALWLAEYLKHEMEMLHPSPYCDAVFQRNETKTIKLIIKEALVASSGDIITDYNDLHCLFIVASRCVNITMSAFVIRETTNNKHYSTQLKTLVWIISSRNILAGCESEASDCPCKVWILPLYRYSLSISGRLLPGSGNSPPKNAMHTLSYLGWPLSCSGSLFSSCVLFWKPTQSSFAFTTKHSVSTTWRRRQQQYYSENKNHAPFFAYTFGLCFANLPTSWCRHVGACLNELF